MQTTLAQPSEAVLSPQERGEAIAEVLASYPEMGSLEEHIAFAVALGNLGVHIALVKPGTKVPSIDLRNPAERAEDEARGLRGGGWQWGTTDPQRLTDYITRFVHQGKQLPNLGVHLGPSRLIVVDADNEGDTVSWNLHQDRRCHSLGVPSVENPFSVLSPGKVEGGKWVHKDGAHCYYVLPPHVDTDLLRTISEKDVPRDEGREGWEIKLGSMGAVLPPSVRSEGTYVATGAPIPVAPEWLLSDLAKPVILPRVLDDSSEAVEFRESVDEALAAVPWSEVMEGIAYHDGQTCDGDCEVWTRHGGSRRSMVVHHGCSGVNGANCVTVHSPTVISMYSLPEKSSGRSYTKWELLAAFQHGGDMGAVAREHGFSRPPQHSVVVGSNPFGMSVDRGFVPVFDRPLPVPAPDPGWDDICRHRITVSDCATCARELADRQARELLDGGEK